MIVEVTNNPTVNEGGRVFNIVSGSLETGVGVIIQPWWMFW